MNVGSDIVTFTVDRATYGVAVEHVREILDMREVSPVPKAPKYLMGVIDLRGENVPVIDLRTLLGLPVAEDTPNTRILVTLLEHEDIHAVIGIRTDRVIEVTRMDDDELRPMEEAEVMRWSECAIAGIGRRNGEIVSVIDLENLFASIPSSMVNGSLMSGETAA